MLRWAHSQTPIEKDKVREAVVSRARLGSPGSNGVQWDLMPLEAAADGYGIETKSVASRTPVPRGVGIETRYGTIRRVPATGASETSASRRSTRYLITGRSGMNPA